MPIFVTCLQNGHIKSGPSTHGNGYLWFLWCADSSAFIMLRALARGLSWQVSNQSATVATAQPEEATQSKDVLNVCKLSYDFVTIQESLIKPWRIFDYRRVHSVLPLQLSKVLNLPQEDCLVPVFFVSMFQCRERLQAEEVRQWCERTEDILLRFLLYVSFARSRARNFLFAQIIFS